METGNATLSLKGGSPRACIVRTIRKWIDDGVLERGIPIPPERELARRLGASQRSVQKALEILEGEKLILRKGVRTRIVPELKGAKAKGMLSDAVIILSNDSVPNPAHGPGWTDAIQKGILSGISEAGLHAFSLNPKISATQLEGFLKQSPAGVLIVDLLSKELMPDSEALDRMRSSGTPLVVYGDDPQYQSFDRVSSDHERGACILTKSLLDSGRKHIAMTWQGALDSYWKKARVSGYEMAMREAGLDAMPPLVEVEFSPEAPTEQLKLEALSNYHAGYLASYIAAHGRPDALMSFSDGLVFSLAAACRKLGIEPGRDIEIVGYDNYWNDFEIDKLEPYMPPASVDKRNAAMGLEMVKLLLQRKAGAIPQEPQIRIVEPLLVPIDRRQP